MDRDAIIEQVAGRRESFIALHTTDVVEFLSQHPALPSESRHPFREIASLILSLLHHLYRQRHEQLTYIYAPLDPDRDRLLTTVPTPASRDRLARDLFSKLPDVLHRANYHRLSQEQIEQAIRAASRWGVRMRIRFDTLDHLEVYGRGEVVGQRAIRRWQHFYRLEHFEVPLYQRIVVIFRTNREFKSAQFDPQYIYLRMFKNVPQQDVDMLLPALGIQMSWLDHSRIVVPSVYAAAITLWRFLRNVLLLAFFGVFKTVAMVVLVLFAIGFGIKSMFTYRSQTKRRYLLNMAQSLYYQNLDNNAGALLRLLEDGEQQEACEAILAYFAAAVLLPSRVPAPTDRPFAVQLSEVDQACEELLGEATQWQVDFDVENTVRNLSQLGIMHAVGVGWQAQPLDEALGTLDRTWDNWFS